MKAFIFDTETTGLVNHPRSKSKPRIIELGANIVDLESKEIQFSIYGMFNPGFQISEEIEKITGIKQTWLDKPDTIESFFENPLVDARMILEGHSNAEALSFLAVRETPTYIQLDPAVCAERNLPFKYWSQIIDSVDTMIAHNLPFDTDCLAMDLLRCGYQPSGIYAKNMICTVQEHFEDFGRFCNLEDLYSYYMGKPLAQTHRALDDVDALTKIVFKMNL